MQLKIYLLASLLLLGACKKEPEPAPSKTELLTAHRWRLTAHTATTTVGGVTTTRDNYAAIPACAQDDSFQFQADNTFLVDLGTSRCITTYSQTAFGVWEFLDNETGLAYVQYLPDRPYLNYKLVELSATTLHVSRTEKPDINQNDVRYDYIYTAL
jgi:hypothetical protein